MLKKDRIVLLFLIIGLFSCSENKDKLFKKKSREAVTITEYQKILKVAFDTIFSRKEAKLDYYKEQQNENEYTLDTLLCFNKSGDRLISCLLARTLLKNASMDGLGFFYGEKINYKWYFFHGPSVVIPRSMVKGQEASKPLSYEQLHEIALKEVYSPYLTSSGEINEEWFIEHFEGPGWGDFNNQPESDWALKGKRFTNKKEYFEYVHLQAAIGIWATRDTTQPIKRLEKTKPVLP